MLDNYATHKTAEVRAWLAEHPRFHVHFTPTSASWLNLVEVWFSIIERQTLRRVDVASAAELNKRIRGFVTGWNDRSHPFVWTKTPEQILKKLTEKPLQTRTARAVACLRGLTAATSDSFKCSRIWR